MSSPNKIPNRLLPLVLLVTALGFVATARAQEAKSSPSPSPSPSPSASPEAREAARADVTVESDVRVEPDVDVTVDVDVDTHQIEESMRLAQSEALRAGLIAERQIMLDRPRLERNAERMAQKMVAQSMAINTEARARMTTDAKIAAEKAALNARLHVNINDEVHEVLQEVQQVQRDREREARDRAREKAQEARDRAREADQDRRDREHEKREALREKRQTDSERADALYEEAMSSIDEEEWNDALRPLSKLMTISAKIDASLYWTAYAQSKMGRAGVALETLAKLQKDFPVSRWTKEGKALEMEVRGKSGQTPRPEQQDDLDMKLMALSALAQSDPKEAMPILSKLLASPTSPRKIRERALFVLAQMGSEQASTAIADVARGNSSPELQRKAIQYLGVFGGPNNRRVLSDVYATTNDMALRKEILNSFMVAGDKARVLNAAKTETNPGLRTDAVRLLGIMGGTAELSQMYASAASADEKKNILHALFLSGAVDQVAAAARNEKDKDVRLAAVRNLGLMGRKSQNTLAEMYKSETDPGVKKELLNAFFLQNNSPQLVEIARAEKDPSLKKEAVHWLSLMNSKESRAYMIELLKD